MTIAKKKKKKKKRFCRFLRLFNLCMLNIDDWIWRLTLKPHCPARINKDLFCRFGITKWTMFIMITISTFLFCLSMLVLHFEQICRSTKKTEWELTQALVNRRTGRGKRNGEHVEHCFLEIIEKITFSLFCLVKNLLRISQLILVFVFNQFTEKSFLYWRRRSKMFSCSGHLTVFRTNRSSLLKMNFS